jgi:hypothetical protein
MTGGFASLRDDGIDARCFEPACVLDRRGSREEVRAVGFARTRAGR